MNDFLKYLDAKTSIDDFSLNKQVWQTMLSKIQPPNYSVLELGGGIGTMYNRLCEAEEQCKEIEYLMLDSNSELVQEAKKRIRNRHFRATCVDVIDYMEANTQKNDLIIAHAFMDLVDTQTIIPYLKKNIKEGGYFYLSMNYDGATIFQPDFMVLFELELMKEYHRTMDERISQGDSQSGRHLLAHLLGNEAHVEVAGSSDWVVFPHQKHYKNQEVFFLKHILHTIYENTQESSLNQDDLLKWYEHRMSQVAKGELIYIAHQLDILGYFL